MKKIVCLAVFIFLLFSLQAQYRIGLKGGVNVSDMNMSFQNIDIDVYQPKGGFQIGFVGEWMFNSRYGVQAELQYMLTKSDIDSNKFLENMEAPSELLLSGYTEMHTLQIPFYFKMKFTLSPTANFYVMPGLYASYSPSAYQHVALRHEDESLKLKWSLFDYQVHLVDKTESNSYLQSRYNAGFVLETGVEINEWGVGASLRKTLTNMGAFGYMGVGKVKTEMWVANLSVSYLF